jgi:hypothetical protein
MQVHAPVAAGLVAAGLVAAGLVAAGLVAAGLAGFAADVVAVADRPPGAPGGPLRADTVGKLRHDGTFVRVVEPAAERPHVGRASAIRRAGGNFGLDPEHGTADEVSLARVTLDTRGRWTLLPGPPAVCRFVREVENRLLWIVVFDDVPTMQFSRPTEEAGLPEPPPGRGTWLHLVDAGTGKVLTSQTLFRSDVGGPPYLPNPARELRPPKPDARPPGSAPRHAADTEC